MTEDSIENWVDSATVDRIMFRQAIHTILLAISNSDYLKPRMIIKGGILLAIRYKSTRFTEDIDFSTSEKLKNIDADEFESELNESLQIASDELSYGVLCRVQSLKIQPKKKSGEATFPAFKLTISYAVKDDVRNYARFLKGDSTNTVKIDYSFNEDTHKVDEITLLNDDTILAYSFTDLIAEKIRAMMQQVIRDRERRQDIYDIHYLLSNIDNISEEEKFEILKAIFQKSRGRVPFSFINESTFDNDDIKNKSQKNYDTLSSEVIGELPPFDESYDIVNHFYKSLPWECFENQKGDEC